MIQNEKGGYTLGPYDLLGIMRDTSTGRFHAAVWLENPLPGDYEALSFVRLKNKFHHTAGSETYEGAVEHVAELRKKFDIADSNVWTARPQVVDRDFARDGYAEVVMVPKEDFQTTGVTRVG
jgi:hypothetical protein